MSKLRLPDIEYLTRLNDEGKVEYVFVGNFTYTDPKTGKTIEIFDGDRSDGSTGGIDIFSASWLVHDKICKVGQWSDGTPINAITAARVLSQILWSEGRRVRACYWGPITFAFGCKKVRKNGWWQ